MREERKVCSCGTVMDLKLRDFSIGSDGSSPLMAAFLDQYVVDLYACPQCGKVELYTASFKEEERTEEVTCPVCGTRHSPLIGCPHCALNAAQTGRASRPKKARDKKLPWEK